MSPITNVTKLLEMLDKDQALRRQVIWQWLIDMIDMWFDQLLEVRTPTAASSELASQIVYAHLLVLTLFCDPTEEDRRRRNITTLSLRNSRHLLLSHNHELAQMLQTDDFSFGSLDHDAQNRFFDQLKDRLPSVWSQFQTDGNPEHVILSERLDTLFADLFNADRNMLGDLEQLFKRLVERSHICGELKFLTEDTELPEVKHLGVEPVDADLPRDSAEKPASSSFWPYECSVEFARQVANYFPTIFTKKAHDIEAGQKVKQQSRQVALFGRLQFLTHNSEIPDIK